MKNYILAIDEGTTSTKSFIFNKKCKILGDSSIEIPQIYPNPGWVEQDPMIIYSNQYNSILNAIKKAKIPVEEIACIGITNQRETTIVWDKNTGEPIYNAIVWQCRRTIDICESLKKYKNYIYKKTGLILDPYFSGTKIKWILDNVEGAREKAKNGDLLFGTVDTWLMWKLSNGKIFATDRTNASRTMLYDINKNCWDKKLLKILKIPKSMLPEVKSSSEVFGYINLLEAEIPISGVAGDQQSALFGQGCLNFGEAKNTYGTGCFLLTNTGKKRIHSKNNLITTIAATGKETINYALEGSVFIGGAVIQWLRDELNIISSSEATEKYAKKVENNNGVYLVPAFTGLGAPYWDPETKGVIVGLTRDTNKYHIVRAALESIAYQSYDVLKAMENDLDEKIKTLKVDGGASNNNLLMQFESNIMQKNLFRPNLSEATALGAAFLAGLAIKFFTSKNEILDIMNKGKTFSPEITENEANILNLKWEKAVHTCISHKE